MRRIEAFTLAFSLTLAGILAGCATGRDHIYEPSNFIDQSNDRDGGYTHGYNHFTGSQDDASWQYNHDHQQPGLSGGF
jgi:hypothetical protein